MLKILPLPQFTMTYSSSTLLFTILLTLLLLFSFAESHECPPQKFTNDKVYDHYSGLHYLNASLHRSYNSSNATLSIAFVAPPPNQDGWISWAINPTGDGMKGAQSLIAFKGSDGNMTVKPYNLISYSNISQEKLSFDVTEMASDYVNDTMRIYATVMLPANLRTEVNQVWQVGGTVTNGRPTKHAMEPENINAKGTLDLLDGEGSPLPAPKSAAPAFGFSSLNYVFLFVFSFVLYF